MVNFNKRKLIYGVGINDADYEVYNRTEEGMIRCPIFVMWSSMMSRCFSNAGRNKNREDIEISEPWLKYSNFKKWFDSNYSFYTGMTLDKDILGNGKLYSESTCAVVPNEINLIIRKYNTFKDSNLPLGVYYHKDSKSFVARCKTDKVEERIRSFDHLDAHFKYLEMKSRSILKLVDNWKQDVTYVDEVGCKLVHLSKILLICSIEGVQITEISNVLHSESFRALWRSI